MSIIRSCGRSARVYARTPRNEYASRRFRAARSTLCVQRPGYVGSSGKLPNATVTPAVEVRRRPAHRHSHPGPKARTRTANGERWPRADIHNGRKIDTGLKMLPSPQDNARVSSGGSLRRFSCRRLLTSSSAFFWPSARDQPSPDHAGLIHRLFGRGSSAWLSSFPGAHPLCDRPELLARDVPPGSGFVTRSVDLIHRMGIFEALYPLSVTGACMLGPSPHASGFRASVASKDCIATIQSGDRVTYCTRGFAATSATCATFSVRWPADVSVSLSHAARPTRCSTGLILRSSHPAISAFPDMGAVTIHQNQRHSRSRSTVDGMKHQCRSVLPRGVGAMRNCLIRSVFRDGPLFSLFFASVRSCCGHGAMSG